MTTALARPSISWDRVEGFMSAARQERTEYLSSWIVAACLALRPGPVRCEAGTAIVDRDTFEHGLKRAGSLQVPAEFEAYARRLTPLAAASEMDLTRACQNAWLTAAADACHAGVQTTKNWIGHAFRRGVDELDAAVNETVTPIAVAVAKTVAPNPIAIVQDERQGRRE